MEEIHVDALIVGAGFGGIYQLYSLLQLGLSVRVIDTASDVGGTWFWNRYPGAMSDTESYVYRYSWDKEDLQTYPWSEHYVKQPQALAYLEHVVKKNDLRQYMQFNTELLSAEWGDADATWRIHVTTGQTFIARYLITALGLLSRQNYPAIEGIDTFKGTKVHTASWTSDIDVNNKRVGIIGNGSTGVQVITEIASKVKTLTSFQRNPQYSVPSGDGPVTPEYRKHINENYDAIMDQVKDSVVGFGFVESTRLFEDATAEEREQVFEELWKKGNGFRFLFGGFCDITTNREANEAVCTFIREKISQIVQDSEKAAILKPYDYYARRPLCDGGYYEQFNRDNVFLIDLKKTPILRITDRGIRTSDGREHEFDIIIFATGFDAVEGNYTRVHIRGVGGRTLQDHWSSTGPTSYLGACVPYLPNMFMITGPQGPFTNIPPAIEAHVELITKAIAHAEEISTSDEQAIVEATPAAEYEWGQKCEAVVEGSLFKETASWMFGKNVPGKKVALRFYFGGLKNFRAAVKSAIDNGWSGFKPMLPAKANGLGQESSAQKVPTASVTAGETFAA